MAQVFKVVFVPVCALLLNVSCMLGTAAWAAGEDDTPAVVSLDFLGGDWSILDAEGQQIGESKIVLQAPGAMLFEERTVGGKGPQALWLANSEKYGGWTQLFVGPAGIREFPPQSAPGEWPLVMGAPVTLQSGDKVVFRLTMSRESDDRTRRVLEMSSDGGARWKTFLDYTYVRVQE